VRLNTGLIIFQHNILELLLVILDLLQTAIVELHDHRCCQVKPCMYLQCCFVCLCSVHLVLYEAISELGPIGKQGSGF